MSFSLPENMPELSLGIPSERSSIGGVELNADLLRHWIKELPNNNFDEYIQLYRDALQRFNLNKLDVQQRLALLDLYREPLNNILFKLSLEQLSKRVPTLAKRHIVINGLAELMAELAIGYKIAVIDAGENNNKLKINPVALLAINRAGEQLNYMVLHAYKFHQEVPALIFHELHQLYQLTMSANVENKTPVVNQNLQSESSFKQLYSQLMLISISNPYGLRDNEVLKAYQVMEQLADVTEITPLPPSAKATAGHFYINCLRDHIPTPSVLPVLDNQAQPPALILNTKPVLVIVDSLFEQPKKEQDLAAETQMDLLRLLIPFLNTSYERKQPRTAVTGNKQAYIATGLTAVHHCLNEFRTQPDEITNKLSSPWKILNKNGSGYLLCRQSIVEQQEITIGDFVGIFEFGATGKPLARIAFIRWMKTDASGKTKIGLSIIEGDPVSVHYSITADQHFQPALLLPEIDRIKQAASLITASDVFAVERNLTIRPKKKRFQFSMTISDLLNSGNNYEHFALSELAEKTLSIE
ncbi:MAG: hypothetical protein ACKE9I_03270 [Methylophagaceae bacterium]